MRNRRGFTLIELLVVTAIIGILSGIILASLANARMRSRSTKRITDLRALRNAIEVYRTEHDIYPKTFEPGNSPLAVFDCYTGGSQSYEHYIPDTPFPLMPKFIDTLPHDPSGQCIAGNGGWNYVYVSDGINFKIMIIKPNAAGTFEDCAYGKKLGFEDPKNGRHCNQSDPAWAVYSENAADW